MTRTPGMGLGSCYVDLDRAEDAINAYVQAIRVNPRMAPAHCNLGMTYRERWKALFY
jgi:Flp pilus assembly protein TadD